MTPNFVVWIVICYLSVFCRSQYITTESWQFTNLVLILIGLSTVSELRYSDSAHGSPSQLSVSVSAGVGGPELTEPEPERDLSQSLSDSWPLAHRALTGLGLSLVTWPHLWPLIGQGRPHRFCCRLLVTLWSALGPASPRL